MIKRNLRSQSTFRASHQLSREAMKTHNFNVLNHDDKFIPHELFTNRRFNYFQNKYSVYPFFIEKSICNQLYCTLKSGYEMGSTQNAPGKPNEGILQIKEDLYHGYNNYGMHKGSANKAEAEAAQKRNTTLIEGNDLARLKGTLLSFRQIVEQVEFMTGLQAFSAEILRQSDTGK